MAKYIFVTGGVLSGLGKGVVAASLGLLLKLAGYRVTAIKIDPYLNVDAGTMNPYMHGEVFVTEDGGETDLDIGHYERFLGQDLSRKNNITSGQVYHSVIAKEREGKYLGQCVQIIPHVTDEIKSKIREVARESGADVVLVEIGGTVGDIEGLPFLEAIRQMRLEEGAGNTLFVHVALAPLLPSGELKTKPIQHSIQELRRIGIQPDIVVARSSKELDADARYKISLYGSIEPRAVISDPDVDTIYRVPLLFHKQDVARLLMEKLGLPAREPNLSAWADFVKRIEEASETVRVAMIGKYTKITDSYLSIIEALRHASALYKLKVSLKWFESTDIENRGELIDEILGMDGAVILPGFGRRGTEGKIAAIKALRENGKPVLGICFGMQLMAIEYARNVLGLEGANSTELDPNTPHPVVDLLEEQKGVNVYGGTMRLGARKIIIEPGTIAWEMYRSKEVFERHRHRYGLNPKYIDLYESNGLRISGWSEDGHAEFVELSNSGNIFIGTQAHPEFKSRPLSPSPFYAYFIGKISGKI